MSERERLPSESCPFCGSSRRPAPFFSHTASDAERRRWICPDCAATWSTDGAQLDLFGESVDPVSAPAQRAED